GHVVSYRERNHKRGFWRQVFLAALVFGALFYLIADSALALFGGILPQANFAILLVAITSFDLKTRRNCYSSLWISLAILYLAAVHLSAELFELQRRPREPGPPTGPAHRRSDGRDDQRRPALSGKARRRARDVRADRRPRLLARPGFRPVSRWRLDSHESRLPRDAAIRATAIPATCAAPQPRHLRADISGPTTAAGRDQRRLPDREPVRAGGRAARGCLRNFPHAGTFAAGPDILGRLLPARSLA